MMSLKAEKDQQKEQKQDEPLMDEVVSVNYAKAADVVKNLDRLKTPRSERMPTSRWTTGRTS